MSADLSRPFTLWDIPLVMELQDQGTQLDMEMAILRPHTPLMAAFMALFPLNAIGASTYVLYTIKDGQRVRGFAQTRDRGDLAQCDVVYMAPSLSRDDLTHEAWRHLLNYLCTMKGEEGIQRIFAKLTTESEDAMLLFRQVGFGVYAREEILRLKQWPSIPFSPEKMPLRPQEERDAWDLQRLYSQITPRLVQQAEGTARRDWESLPSDRLRRSRKSRGYVLEAEGEIVGCLHIRVGQRGHWLRMLLHPQAEEQADTLLRGGLALLSEFPPCPIYCGVREYEMGLRGALERAGFQHCADRSLLVKHTTVRVKEPAMKLVPSLERKAEIAPTVSRHLS